MCGRIRGWSGRAAWDVVAGSDESAVPANFGHERACCEESCLFALPMDLSHEVGIIMSSAALGRRQESASRKQLRSWHPNTQELNNPINNPTSRYVPKGWIVALQHLLTIAPNRGASLGPGAHEELVGFPPSNLPEQKPDEVSLGSSANPSRCR